MNKIIIAALTALMLVGSAFAVYADDIYIDLTVNADANDITLDLVNGSPQLASVVLEYNETNGDGKNGCNLGGQASQVSFPINVATVSGAPASLDKTHAVFTDCNQTVTINISATAVGVIGVTLGTPTFTTNHSDVTTSSWNVSGADFSVTVVDSTQFSALDAPEIANAYLGARADNSDCKARWGTNKNKANWHGQLISHVAQHFQGQTFSEATKSVVENYVENACTA